MLSAGHAFCKVNQGGTDATIGYSSGSKFWSSSYLPIPEYVSWCDTFGKKIVNGKLEVKTNTNYDRLPIPTGISKYSKDNLIENLYVLPSEQCKGYGTKLLKYAEEKCQGIPKLWILSNNNAAKNLYVKHGYTFTGNVKPLKSELQELEMQLIR